MFNEYGSSGEGSSRKGAQRGLQSLVWEVNCDTTSQHPSPLQGFTLAPSEPLSSPTGTTEHDDWPHFTAGKTVPGRFTACPKPHRVPSPASCITVAWLRGDVSGVEDRGMVSSTLVDVTKVDLKVALPIYKPTKILPDPRESLSFHERFLWRQGWLACCRQSLGALSSASLWVNHHKGHLR